MRYLISEELFNIINSEKYENVTKEQVQIYLDLCETSKPKKFGNLQL